MDNSDNKYIVTALLEIKQDIGSLTSSVESLVQERDEDRKKMESMDKDVKALRTEISFWKTVLWTLRGVWLFLIGLVGIKFVEASDLLKSLFTR